jgi:hypothetical protein
MCQFDKVAAHQALELVIRTVSRLEIGAERHMVGRHKLRIEQKSLNLAKAVIESGAEPQGPSAHGISCTATAYATPPVLLGAVTNAGAEAFDRAAQLR